MYWRLLKSLRPEFILIGFFAWTVLFIVALALNVGHVRLQAPPALFAVAVAALMLAFFLIAPLFSSVVQRLVLNPSASLDDARDGLFTLGAIAGVLGLACLLTGIGKL